MKNLYYLCFLCLIVAACSPKQQKEEKGEEVPSPTSKLNVILDTDANNEIDDQHAIAYMLFNGNVFDVPGITVNRTSSGGPLINHVEEAKRVVKLCGLDGKIGIYTGADKSLSEIEAEFGKTGYDGEEAVNFIIEQAKQVEEEPLILVPIGKLTNIALALKKAPEIIDKVRIVWLGSNYPEPGEHNQVNDTAALSFILKTNVPFEMVTVRYGKDSGSDAVRATPGDISAHMGGSGPQIKEAITGRHGGSFNNFGDYAFDLFSHIELHGEPPSRALFDVVALAILKNPEFGEKREIPAPKLINNEWIDQPDNSRKIVLWENFDEAGILEDFFDTMNDYVLVE